MKKYNPDVNYLAGVKSSPEVEKTSDLKAVKEVKSSEIPVVKPVVPKIGVPEIHGHKRSSSSSSEDSQKGLKLSKPGAVNVPKIVPPGIKDRGSSSDSSEDESKKLKLGKPDLKLPLAKAEVPSTKVEIPKIGIPGA